MTTEREAFEAWWRSIYRMPHEDKTGAFYGWQASRKVAFEDAARACDGETWVIGAQRTSTYMETFNKACHDCMKAIRSLK